MVHDGLDVTDDVGDLHAQRRVDGNGHRALDLGRDREVRERDVLVDEEGVSGEVRLERPEGTELAFAERGVVGRYVGRDLAGDEASDAVGERADLALGERHPLIDEGGFLGVRAEEVRVGGERGDCSDPKVGES